MVKICQDNQVKGKTIIIRADCNVPLDKKTGMVSDATRLERFAPTIKKYTSLGAKLVILSHFGRPDGQKKPSMSLRPVCQKLAEILGEPIEFIDDCIGQGAEQAVKNLPFGRAIMAENVRFYAEEEKNDSGFAQKLSKLGDLFMNDAFSCSHRAHASVVGIANYLPAVAGPSLLAEVSALEQALEKPKRPSVAVVGGAKISSKIAVLKFLVKKLDYIIIGGGMANTFYLAQGYGVGKSLAEPDSVPLAREIMQLAGESQCQIYLPSDGVVANEFAANAPHKTIDIGGNIDGMILDAGPKAIKEMLDIINKCQTILWNGPLGAFEMQPFDNATNMVARHVASRTKNGQLISIAGGGDTVSALNNSGVGDDFTYISTAGGAFLEWLEGIDLPGIKILQ